VCVREKGVGDGGSINSNKDRKLCTTIFVCFTVCAGSQISKKPAKQQQRRAYKAEIEKQTCRGGS
jgi:hypothetical protein